MARKRWSCWQWLEWVLVELQIWVRCRLDGGDYEEEERVHENWSATFMRKQARKKGAHADAGTLDSEPPVGNPDDASSKKTNQKHDVAPFREKLPRLSAVNSLKRNLTAFKKASKSDL
ncbi:hypothetical protein VPH35_095761 [Triticum aestivum]|uniref:Uncharacterized protein n=1 Tax=Aegilops tauschii TaxID=37682 RepID=N1QWQ9_AEGTA